VVLCFRAVSGKRRKRARRKQQRTTRPHSTKQGSNSREERATNSASPPRRRWNWAAATSLLAVLVSAVALIAPHLTAQADQRQADIAEKERCDKLFDQAAHKVGDPASLDMRLAGIHHLDILSVECPEHHTKVVTQLASYVRRHSPVALCVDPSYHVPDDVAEAMVVLGNRIIEPAKTANEYSVNLDSTCLRGLDLSSLNFTRAYFAGSDLSHTDLSGTKFQGAYFLSANFERAKMMHSDFTCAVLANTRLQEALLVRATFVGADLLHSNLLGAATIGTDFRNAVLANALIGKDQLDQAIVQPGPPVMHCVPPDNFPPVF
jgi:hypothetical protein